MACMGAVHVVSHLLLHRGSFCQNWVLRHGQLFIRCWGTVSGGGWADRWMDGGWMGGGWVDRWMDGGWWAADGFGPRL